MKSIARATLALVIFLLGGSAFAAPAWLDPTSAQQQAGSVSLKGCPGCCSHHGGITNSCGIGGRVLCQDGTTSPSCSCGSCGVSSGPPSCSYTYSDWSPCQPNGTQTRTILSSGAPGCVGSPGPVVQSCIYTPPSCTYTYTEWSACRPDGTQARSILSSGASGCVGTPAALTQPCVYIAPGGTNYTALWWDPAESGWGVYLNHQDGTLFVTIFTYGTNGAPMWLVGSNVSQQLDGSFSGDLFRVTGPAFDAKPWTPVAPSLVGNVTLRFTNSDHGTIVYRANSSTVTKPIQRQVFATNVSCSGTTASRADAKNFQDLWWNPRESGWGVNLAHQGDIIFAALFTYERAGADLWLVAPAMKKQTDGSYAGSLYKTSGVPFNANTWASAAVTEVGTMSARFSSGEAGTLTYTYSGATVTKSIQRQVFGKIVPDCH